jgi:hypothetical protein
MSFELAEYKEDKRAANNLLKAYNNEFAEMLDQSKSHNLANLHSSLVSNLTTI